MFILFFFQYTNSLLSIGDSDEDVPIHQDNGRNNVHPPPPLHNPAPPNRRRSSFVPFDNNAKSLRVLNRHTEISLSDLKTGETLYQNPPPGINLNRCMIAGQLLRVIMPGRDQNNFSYQRKYKTATTSSTMKYHRIFMFCVVSEQGDASESRQIFYMMQNATTNTELFNRNTNFRDNGIITIGTILMIVNPNPVERFMQNIPMLTTNERAIAIQPINHPTALMNNDLDGNDCKAFVINNALLNCTRLVFTDSKCSGLFCDRQRVLEICERSGCGCFSQHSNRNCVTALHYIVCQFNGKNIGMNNFSSHVFMSYYIFGHFSIDIRASQLQSGSEIYDDILDAMENIIKLVNENGGWSIYGWGKKGIINDTSLVGVESNNDDAKVTADEVSTHFVQLHPQNREFQDIETDLGRQMQDFKFNVATHGVGSIN